jgi:hypothetical protein
MATLHSFETHMALYLESCQSSRLHEDCRHSHWLTGLKTEESEFDHSWRLRFIFSLLVLAMSETVSVGFKVNKAAQGQVSRQVVRISQPFSLYRCSILIFNSRTTNAVEYHIKHKWLFFCSKCPGGPWGHTASYSMGSGVPSRV